MEASKALFKAVMDNQTRLDELVALNEEFKAAGLPFANPRRQENWQLLCFYNDRQADLDAVWAKATFEVV